MAGKRSDGGRTKAQKLNYLPRLNAAGIALRCRILPNLGGCVSPSAFVRVQPFDLPIVDGHLRACAVVGQLARGGIAEPDALPVVEPALPAAHGWVAAVVAAVPLGLVVGWSPAAPGSLAGLRVGWPALV